MNKLMMIALLVVATCSAMAQPSKKDSTVKKDKPPAVNKIEYPGLPNEKIITLQVSVPAYQLSDFSIVHSVGGVEGLRGNDNVSMKRGILFINAYQATLDSLNTKWGNYVKADALKWWQADTAKRARPVFK